MTALIHTHAVAPKATPTSIPCAQLSFARIPQTNAETPMRIALDLT